MIEWSRTFWASVDPVPGFDRRSATRWLLYINLGASDGQSVREASTVVDTTAAGFAGLMEVDTYVVELGYLRSSAWELGSGHGFVAWVEPDVDAILYSEVGS